MRDDAWLAGFADGEGCFKMDADNAPVFSLLRQALIEGRAFDQTAVPASPQLKLISDDSSSTLTPAGESALAAGLEFKESGS